MPNSETPSPPRPRVSSELVFMQSIVRGAKLKFEIDASRLVGNEIRYQLQPSK